MDLNICLYCEKRLANDDLSFCSPACQTQEATKHCSLVARCDDADPYLSSRKQPQPRTISRRTSATPPAFSPATPPSSYEMSYHRRRSFLYSKDASPPSPSAAHASILSAYMPPADSVSLVSNTSTDSSDMESVHTAF